MSYFNNDHLQIDNIIIDFEENISKISSFNQILNSIENLDEFIDLKKQINNLFNDIENDTNTLVNTLKIIQFNIRKLYDDFSLLQNNYEDIEEKLKMIINENSLLINRNKEISENIKSKNLIIEEQEKYINKLLEIIKSSEILKENINKQFLKNEKNKSESAHKNIINKNEISMQNISAPNINNTSNKKNINNKKGSKKKHFNYNMRKNNSANLNNLEVNNIPNKDFNTIQNYSKKNFEFNSNQNNNKNLNTLDKNLSNSISTGKYVFHNDFDDDEDDNNKIKNRKNYSVENRIEKVEKIISVIYKNNNLYSMLKSKYGEDLDNKIINENVSIQFLDEILKDISEFQNQYDNKFNKFSTNKGKKNKNELITKTGKAVNNEINNNILKNDETESKLTNYFLFNLQREKMIDSQQKKEYIRPKTPKL